MWSRRADAPTSRARDDVGRVSAAREREPAQARQCTVLARRNALGVEPVMRLNALLNADSDV